MQKRLVQTKVYYKLCYSVWNETFHKPLKVTAAKKSSQVCISLTQLFSMNAFYFMWWLEGILVYKNLVLPRVIEATAMLLCRLKQMFWKKSAVYLCCFYNNIAMLLILKVPNKASTSSMFIALKIYLLIVCFYSFQFVCVPQFSL